MQENFYVKKLYYGNYVKNVVLPMSLIIGNKRNEKGIKNIGNITKLRNNTIRTRNALIHKTFHNFSSAKCLSFLTLTYKDNVTDLNKAKHDIAIFFKRLKRWWNDPKRAKYLGELKYMYVYEYQKRGAIHFHILFNRKIHRSMLPQWWPHAEKIGIRLDYCQNGTNEFVCKYLAKYVVKVQSNMKSQNMFDLNRRAYAFSYNCKKPYEVRGQKIMLYQRLIDASLTANNYTYFKKKIDDYGRTILIGGSFDTTVADDCFKDIEPYSSIDNIRCKNAISNFDPWIFKKEKIQRFLKKVFGDKVEQIIINKRVLH